MDVWKLNQDNTELIAQQAVDALYAGKVIACPTDTVYGLVADATNEEAVHKIFSIKGRESGKAIPIFVRDIEEAKELAFIESEQEKALQTYWPGKVTVLLKSKGRLPRVTGTTETIGLRVPDYPLLELILKKAGVPLTGTSANLSSMPSLSSGADVLSQFKDREYTPDILIDAGKLPLSEPSSVVDLTGIAKKILRQGAVQNL